MNLKWNPPSHDLNVSCRDDAPVQKHKTPIHDEIVLIRVLPTRRHPA